MADSRAENSDVAGGAVMCSLLPSDLNKIQSTLTEVLLEELNLTVYRVDAIGFDCGRRLDHLMKKNEEIQNDKAILKKEVGCLRAGMVLASADSVNLQLKEKDSQLLESRNEVQFVRQELALSVEVVRVAEAERVRQVKLRDDLLHDSEVRREDLSRSLIASKGREAKLEVELASVKADFYS